MGFITLPRQFSSQHLGVCHEARRLLCQHQLGLVLTPRLQAEHALVRLDHIHSHLAHQLLDARQCPGLRIGRILVEEYASSLHLFLIQLGHEFHMLNPFCQLLGFPLAVWDQRLELAERHAGRAPYEY